MELNYTRQTTPTFPTWIKNVELRTENRFDIDRIFCNGNWRTVTFCTDEFRLNFKFANKNDYESTVKQVKSNVSKACKAYILVDYENEACQVKLTKASDADEDVALFEPDDFGYVRTNKPSK